MLLFYITVVISAGLILSIYLLGSLAFALVLIADDYCGGGLKVPLWFALFGYALYSPIILTVVIVKNREGIFGFMHRRWDALVERCTGVHSKQVEGQTEGRP